MSFYRCALLFSLFVVFSSTISYPVLVGTSFDSSKQRTNGFLISGSTIYKNVVSSFPLDVNCTYQSQGNSLFVFATDASFYGLYLAQIDLLTFETKTWNTFYTNDVINYYNLPLGMYFSALEDKLLVIHKSNQQLILRQLSSQTKQTTATLLLDSTCTTSLSDMYSINNNTAVTFALQCETSMKQFIISLIDLRILQTVSFAVPISKLFVATTVGDTVLIGLSNTGIIVGTNLQSNATEYGIILSNTTISVASMVQDISFIYILAEDSLFTISKSTLQLTTQMITVASKTGVSTMDRKLVGWIPSELLDIPIVAPTILATNVTMYLSVIISHKWIVDKTQVMINNNQVISTGNFSSPCLSIDQQAFKVKYPSQVVCIEVATPVTIPPPPATIQIAITPEIIPSLPVAITVKEVKLKYFTKYANPFRNFNFTIIPIESITLLDVKCSITYRKRNNEFTTYYVKLVSNTQPILSYSCLIQNIDMEVDSSIYATINLVNMGKHLLPQDDYMISDTIFYHEFVDEQFQSKFVYKGPSYSWIFKDGTLKPYFKSKENEYYEFTTIDSIQDFTNAQVVVKFTVYKHASTERDFVLRILLDDGPLEFKLINTAVTLGTYNGRNCYKFNEGIGTYYLTISIKSDKIEFAYTDASESVLCGDDMISGNPIFSLNGAKIQFVINGRQNQLVEMTVDSIVVKSKDSLLPLPMNSLQSITSFFTVVMYVFIFIGALLVYGWPITIPLFILSLIFGIVFCIKIVPRLCLAKPKMKIDPFGYFPSELKKPVSNPANIEICQASFYLPLSKRVLHKANLSIKAGTLTAILGPSGGGKTTTLNLISSRFELGMVHPRSKVFINRILARQGMLVDVNMMKKIAVVPQQAIMLQSFSVIETLQYAAMLRGSFKSARKIGNAVLHLLDLQHRSKNAVYQLSGGQQKRVNIGIELCSSHEILLLDEPTTGLDSTSSEKLMKFLKNYAKQYNIPVVTVIHQPQEEVFNIIDNLVLVANNKIVYTGPPSQSINYLSNAGFSFTSVNAVNPADAVIDCLAAPENKHILQTCPPAMVNHKYGFSLQLKEKISAWVKDKVSFFSHFGVCLIRNIAQVFKDFWFAVASLLTIIITATIVGLLFKNVSYEGIKDTRLRDFCPTGFDCSYIVDPLQDCFAMSLLGICLCALTTGVTVFQREFSNFKRESACGLNTLAYFTAKDLVHFVVTVLFGTIAYSAILYGLIAPKMNIGIFFAIFLIAFYVFFGAGYLISLVVPENISQIVGVVFVFVNVVLSGFKPNTYRIWRQQNLPIFYATPFSYLLEWLYLSELDTYRSTFNIEESLMDYGYNYSNLTLCYFVPIVFGLGIRIISILLLYTMNPASNLFIFRLLFRNTVAIILKILEFIQKKLTSALKLLFEKIAVKIKNTKSAPKQALEDNDSNTELQESLLEYN